MRLLDLVNRHAGKPCWICGTGPSLDDAIRHGIDGPRICINRAAFAVPYSAGETYWLVLDDAWGLGVAGPWKEHLEKIRGGMAGVAVLRNPLLGTKNPTPSGNCIVQFTPIKSRDREQDLALEIHELAAAGRLYERIGSGATAVHLAWLLGCDTIRLAGIDGGYGRAAAMAEYYRGEELDDTPGYDTGLKYVHRAIEMLGMCVEEWRGAAV